MNIKGEVKFGKTNKKMVTWSILNLREDGQTAILITDSVIGLELFSKSVNKWEQSSLRQLLNNGIRICIFVDLNKMRLSEEYTSSDIFLPLTSA